MNYSEASSVTTFAQMSNDPDGARNESQKLKIVTKVIP
ncbi:hypothetical protein Mal48_01220 [Thalassoglobus polymorphus]|uniref:Uncharacterized protein n=1 Tax=Thalassoglobus polymorphus TaxID=2527994 RepID=A0A517QGY7_9PLAN|nr:hypothetical protein Mal48_01220 [Thalassoglobus polymorphus]